MNKQRRSFFAWLAGLLGFAVASTLPRPPAPKLRLAPQAPPFAKLGSKGWAGELKMRKVKLLGQECWLMSYQHNPDPVWAQLDIYTDDAKIWQGGVFVPIEYV